MTEAATQAQPSERARPVLLRVDDLSTTFDTPKGPVRAVEHVNLTLERGATLGIVGESGSGKSVLSRSIMGLVPGYAQRTGSIRFEGQELMGASNQVLRELWGARMAMVFQDPMTALNPVQRIGRQITESINEHLDYSRTQQFETAIALLRSVGIPEPERRMLQYPMELSGGMRQRVVIAIALACGPALLFADEPTTALDVTVQAQILDLLEAQQHEREMAVVLVTHDLGVVATRAHDIAVMYGGRIVEHAPTEVLFRGVRHPYTEALMRSIPRLELPSHTRLEAIGGRPPDLLNPPKGCRFAPRCPHVRERCHQEEPPLEDDGSGHLFRCWYPVEVTFAPARSKSPGAVTLSKPVSHGDGSGSPPVVTDRPTPSAGETYAHPDAAKILTAGVLGLVCCAPLAPVAWVMGHRVLSDIKDRPRTYSNVGVIKAGRILGIIGTVLLALLVARYVAGLLPGDS